MHGHMAVDRVTAVVPALSTGALRIAINNWLLWCRGCPRRRRGVREDRHEVAAVR